MKQKQKEESFNSTIKADDHLHFEATKPEFYCSIAKFSLNL